MNAPDPDQVEVSLIGPGYGESVVVHLGDGEWIVVDSCVEKDEEGFVQSSAVAYLRKIGVDPTKQVSHVVATHWHDDHIAGLSEVVKCCESAEFCCAAAFREEEFHVFTFVYADSELSRSTRTTKEMAKILELLEERNKQPKFLKSDTLVRRKSDDVKVFALSPSDERIRDFVALLASKIPTEAAPRKKIYDMKPNETSVVLLICLGDDAVLLGADLEETPGRGWSVVVSDSEAARGKKASVYKVAHHGSKTAECSEIWDKMLRPAAPFAVLAPLVLGRNSLPSEQDVKRILSRTPNAYSSARLGSNKRSSRRGSPVERTVRESGWGIYPMHPKQGHLRLRRRIGENPTDWSVELYGNAVHLEHIRT